MSDAVDESRDEPETQPGGKVGALELLASSLYTILP
jgi:hypothetical protein